MFERINRRDFFRAIAALLYLNLSAAAGSSPSVDLRDAWKDSSSEFAQALNAGLGFSFKYGDKVVGPNFSDDWRFTAVQDARLGVAKAVWTHETGLTVTRELRVIPKFNAIEYRVLLENSGKKTLAPISDLRALDISFGEPVLQGNCVISSGGGLGDSFLPPRNFALRKSCFARLSEPPSTIDLASEGGRSSGKDLPFFFIQNDARSAGLFAAFGWSGQWAVRASLDHRSGALNLSGVLSNLEIALEPGEKVQGPAILVGLYAGALSEGSNRLRRLIREAYTPQLNGESPLPAATYDTFFGGIGTDFNEASLRKLADSAVGLGEEYFLIDAGWYAGTKAPWDFSPGVGNWYQVDPAKFPDGLQSFSGHLRSKGLKLGLWFEPERVARGSQLAKEHPDWILWKYRQEFKPWGESDWRKNFGVLDYGRPEVQKWVRAMLSHYVREYRVKYIRYDFNTGPLPYWEANDLPNRRGMTELRHVQGLYAVLDGLRQEHPDVVLEGCAGGGRRIDLETARRFHTFWISDQTADPALVRFHLFGINYFLPGNYNYVQYSWPVPHQKDLEQDDLGMQSAFGGAFGLSGRVDRWPQPMKEKARLHVATWKKLRRYLVEDYYALGAQPADLESWSGWQFQDPKDHSGFVQTFRTNTPEATHRFVIHALDERARYRFTDAYGGQSFEIAGSQAMTEGIELKQERNSSRVLTYRRVE